MLASIAKVLGNGVANTVPIHLNVKTASHDQECCWKLGICIDRVTVQEHSEFIYECYRLNAPFFFLDEEVSEYKVRAGFIPALTIDRFELIKRG
ncbi:MAG: hypothetical protein AMJ88_00585 [Anaerolineae bacterium SM23_ 63]|nr:MAG: hypothetical protein AMJ88_00585 [Anaerolineae bacterium SM23_ 63]